MDDQPNNDWRKLTAVIYQKPRDSKIFGSVEFDATELEQFVNTKRREGMKITLTHIFLLAFARGIWEVAPEVNSYVRRGRIVPRKSVDVSLTVLVGGGKSLTSVKVPGAERLCLQGLDSYLQSAIPNVRSGNDDRVQKTIRRVARIPWPLRQWVVDLTRWLTIDCGVNLGFMGVSPDNFGTFVLSNIGSIGLDVGYPALAPFSNVAMVITQGSVSLKPVVHEGQIVARRMITVSAAIDHRVVDAAQMGRLFNYVRRVLKTPEALERGC